MWYKHLLVLLCTSLFIINNMNCQGVLRQEAYRFDVSNFSREASLGQNTGDIVDDSIGQVWASNSAHLLRIGKNQTEIFATSGKDKLDGYIIRLFTDGKKHLWISTNKGIYHLNPLTQEISPHYLTMNGQVIRSQAIDGFGDYIFAGTSAGDLIRYHPASKKATLLQTGFEKSFITFLKRTSTGSVYYANRTHLYQITDSNKIRRICELPAGFMPVYAETIDSKTVYLSTLAGPILKVNNENKQVSILPLASNEISNGVSIKKVIWNGKTYLVQATGTSKGVVWLNPENDQQIFWKNNPFQKGNTLDALVGGLQQDKYGRIWIGCGEKCLSLMPVEANTIPYFLHDDSAPYWENGKEEGPNALVHDQQNNSIVYGIADTLFYFNKSTNTIDKKISLGLGKNINELSITKNGTILAATKNGAYSIKNDRHYLLNDSLKGKNVIRLLLKGDTIFAGTYSHGLYGILQSGDLVEYHGKSTGMTGNYFPAMCLDKAGNIWMVNGRTSLYKRIGTKPIMIEFDNKAIGHSFIYDIIQDLDSSKIWVGGEGGILSYNYNTGITGDITTSVPNGFEFGIYRMHQKKDRNFFVTTTGNKLFEWDTRTKKVLHIDMEKGWWAENMLNTSNIIIDENGTWWGTFRYGLIQFNKNNFFSNADLNAPQIKGLEVNYTPWQYHPIAYINNPLQLKHSESPISIVCSSIYRDKVQFMLEGAENTWQTGEKATYANLREGNYLFKARSIDNVGNFSQEETLMLKILPPWWRTWWFRIFASVSLTLILLLIIRKTINSIQKENEYKIKLANSELKAIRSQMNPHFIFNCMTAIDGLIAKGQNQKASEYLGKFSKLVRQVLQLSEKQLISLRDELDTLKLYLQLEQLRTQDFSFDIQVQDELMEQTEIPPLLLQPMVENAILHGLKTAAHNHKQIKIRVSETDNTIKFEIEDNGIGRKESALKNVQRVNHKSMGSKLTADRLQIMEQLLNIETTLAYEDLQDEMGNALGTKVILSLNSKN